MEAARTHVKADLALRGRSRLRGGMRLISSLAIPLLLALAVACGDGDGTAATPTAGPDQVSPSASATERPSATPAPTDTPEPSPTPVPTATPTPEPDGPGVVTGTIRFRGEPISNVSDGLARFNVRDPDTLDRPRFVTDYDPASGAFELKGLPTGHYRVYGWVDAASPEEKLSGGDFYSGISGMSPEVELTDDSPNATADIPVVQIIHLTFPVDNAGSRTAVGDSPETLLLSAAQGFIWDPVPGAASYLVRVLEFDTATGDVVLGDNNRWIELSETSATIDPPLPRSEDGHHYGFLVDAYDGNDVLIGNFRNFYTNGDGGWFMFRAVERP